MTVCRRWQITFRILLCSVFFINFFSSNTSFTAEKKGIITKISRIDENKTLENSESWSQLHLYPILIQGAVVAGGAYFWQYSERWDGRFKLGNEGGFVKCYSLAV